MQSKDQQEVVDADVSFSVVKLVSDNVEEEGTKGFLN